MNKFWNLFFFCLILTVMISGGMVIGTVIKYIMVMELVDGISILFWFGALFIFWLMYLLSTYAGQQVEIFFKK